MRVALQFLFCFFLFSLHLTLPYARTHAKFSPFAFTPSGHIFDETHFYSPGAHRFAKFGILSHDTDVIENKSISGIYPQAPSFLLGSFSKWIGNFELSWILLHGLLPALLWLVTFLIVRDFQLAWAYVLLGFGPKLALLLSNGAYSEPPDITRIPNPALSAIILTSCAGLLAKCLKDGFPKWLFLPLVVLGGALFEFYPFYALVWFGALSLIFLFLLIERDYPKAKSSFFLLLFSVLMALPSLWRILVFQSQLEQSVILRQGFLSHAPSWPGLLLFGVSFLGFVFAFSQDRYLLATALAFLTVSGLCSNIQVITGADIHYWLHYRMRLVQPILILLGFTLVFSRHKKAGTVFLSLLVAMTFYRQVFVGNVLLENYRLNAPTVEMLRWINHHIEKPSVFASTNLQVIASLPAISGQWSFVPSSYRTQVSDEEILKRLVIASKIEGKTLEETQNFLASKPIVPSYEWTRPLYFFLRKDSLSQDLLVKIESYWKDDTLLRVRQLDYAILPSENQSMSSKGYANLFKNSQWQIVSLKENTLISAN